MLGKPCSNNTMKRSQKQTKTWNYEIYAAIMLRRSHIDTYLTLF